MTQNITYVVETFVNREGTTYFDFGTLTELPEKIRKPLFAYDVCNTPKIMTELIVEDEYEAEELDVEMGTRFWQLFDGTKHVEKPELTVDLVKEYAGRVYDGHAYMREFDVTHDGTDNREYELRVNRGFFTPNNGFRAIGTLSQLDWCIKNDGRVSWSKPGPGYVERRQATVDDAEELGITPGDDFWMLFDESKHVEKPELTADLIKKYAEYVRSEKISMVAL